VTHTYDWSKLDAGWSYEELDGLRMLFFTESMASKYSYLVERLEGDGLSPPTPDEKWNRYRVTALAQLAKCRVVDNTPLFEAMDRIAVEAGAEDVPQYVCSACGKHGLHLCEKFYPEPPSTKWFYPSQPWRRGPLAAWTLVNISKHDGRLTVVMKRGRGEVLIETGVDDEGIWERLALKAVELDKAKAKAAAEAKEKAKAEAEAKEKSDG
jgi:hypothetical protein